jgi:hypothetical protein
VHHVEHAVRQTRLGIQLGHPIRHAGIALGGLSTNVFPVAIAIGCIHNGTMIGKLNGVIPAHTPSGCRNV